MDPLELAQTLNFSVPNAERRIDTVVYNSIRNVINNMNQDDIISGRDGGLPEATTKNIDGDMD